MSVLALVRHAQASFFADDYDCLSPAGEAQAEALGDYWARRGETFSEIYVGPRRRQQRTADLAGASYRRVGLAWPEPIVLEELDEYDLTGLLERLVPALAQHDRDFDSLVSLHRRSQGEADRARSFQRMFEALLTQWQRSPALFADHAVEPWSAFRDRVARGLRQMTAGEGRGRRVAAFSSGGFIGTALARVLDAPDRTALELSWRLRNAALSHVVFSPGRFSLDDFNLVPHLRDPAHWTYR